MTNVPLREERTPRDTGEEATGGGGSDVGMRPQDKESREPGEPEAAGRTLPRASEGGQRCPPLDFGLLASVRAHISVASSPPGRGHL